MLNLLNIKIKWYIYLYIYLFIVILYLFFLFAYNFRTLQKTYQVSYRERERIDDISNPFYGHSIYSRRTTNSIYLPGFSSATVTGTDGKPVKVRA